MNFFFWKVAIRLMYRARWHFWTKEHSLIAGL
jgi:hypothetical protein